MAAGTNAEDVYLRLIDQVAGPAASAEASLKQLESAIKMTETALRSNRSAMSEASDALRAGSAAYREADAAAKATAKAAERVGEAMAKQQAAVDAANEGLKKAWSPELVANAERLEAELSKLNASHADAVGKANAAKAALSAESAALDKLKSAAKAASEQQKNLGEELRDLKSAARDAKKAEDEAAEKTKFENLANSLKGVTGGMGGLFEKVTALRSGIGKAGLAGAAIAAVAVIVLLTAAAISAVVALAGFALASADAARTSSLLSAGIARSVEGGKALDATLDKLGSKVPLTRDELSSMASQLAATGLRGAALSKALEEAAIKAAKLKFGPDFAKQMLSLDVQSRRLKESLATLFDATVIDPFLEGLQNVTSLISQDTEIGQKLRVVLSGAMTGFFAAATAALPFAKEMLVGMLIVALQLYIGFRKMGKALGEAFGDVGGIDGMNAALETGKVAAYAIVLVFGLIAAIVAVVGAAVALFVAPFVLIGKAGTAVGDAIVAAFQWMGSAATDAGEAIKSAVGGAIDWLGSVSLVDVGLGMVTGLITGLTSGAGALIDAVKGLAGSAVTAMKDALLMRSPSKLFHNIGEMGIGEGVAVGVDDSADRVNESVADVVDPPTAKAAAKAGKGGGKWLYIEKLIIGSRDDYEKFREMLRDEFEIEADDASPA